MKRLIVLLALMLPCSAFAQVTNLNDLTIGDTVRCPWRTFNTAGSSATPGTAGTLYVYKNAGTGSEKAIVADLSGTDTRAIDGNAGDHETSFPTTDAFFVAGEYVVRARGSVVDGQTINAALCLFSLEYRFPLKGLIVARGTLSSGSTTSVAQIGAALTFDNQYVSRTIKNITTGEEQIITASDDNGSTDTVTFAPNVPTAWSNGDVWQIRAGSPQYVVTLPLVDSNGGVTVGSFATPTYAVNATTAQGIVNFFNNGGAVSTSTVSDFLNLLTNINTNSPLSAQVIEPNGSVTAKCALSILLASQAGTWTSSGGIATFKDPTGTTTRIVGTIATGSRSGVTITCP